MPRVRLRCKSNLEAVSDPESWSMSHSRLQKLSLGLGLSFDVRGRYDVSCLQLLRPRLLSAGKLPSGTAVFVQYLNPSFKHVTLLYNPGKVRVRLCKNVTGLM